MCKVHNRDTQNVSIMMMEKRRRKISLPSLPPRWSSSNCVCHMLECVLGLNPHWHRSSIINGHFGDERRSARLFIHHFCLLFRSFFPQSFCSLQLSSHCLAGSRIGCERRTRQCYQHATDDSYFQLLPQWLITQTPRRVDSRSPPLKTNPQATGGHLTWPVLSFYWDTFNVGSYSC